MSDQQVPARNLGADDSGAFDQLLSTIGTPAEATFSTVFRGYDRDEVDAAIARLTARLRADDDEIAFLEERYRRVNEVAATQNRDAAERLQRELDAKVSAAEERSRDEVERLKAELAAAQERLTEVEAGVQAEAEAAGARTSEAIERLEAELNAANARVAKAEHRAQTVTDELVNANGESGSRPQFEEILRVAEEQASLVIRNASIQGDRLIEAAREEIVNRRKELHAEGEAILSQSHHEAQQARLRIETELTAHQARIEREAAHAAEKVSQAEQEAATIRTEAEKGAAALRSMVARETSLQRAEAEEAVRELRMRALEFEESLTRRQDDAQQEFLMLHNQAVAHAERITQDANEQVAASIEHTNRVAARAEDFDRLMRAQAQQVEADAALRAREHLDRARAKAQKIIETVTTHSQGVLRDAEDRTRQLRWQQHQLTSFMAEVKELIRPESALGAADVAEQDSHDQDAEAEAVVPQNLEHADDVVAEDGAPDDVDVELAELVEHAES